MKYTVTPLVLGEANVNSTMDVFWGMTTKSERELVPFLGFLIEGGDAPIIVDTGPRARKRRVDPQKAPNQPRLVEHALPAALAKRGLDPEDIAHCILTHMHFDHVGGCELLPNATFYVQRSELAAAATPIGPKTLDMENCREGLFYHRIDVAAFVYSLWDRVVLLEGDTELFPGINCVLYSNSHTPGSQCVYIDTDNGVLSLVGDIIRKIDINVDREIPPGLFYDFEEIRRAILDIKRRSDIIWTGHDPELVKIAE